MSLLHSFSILARCQPVNKRQAKLKWIEILWFNLNQVYPGKWTVKENEELVMQLSKQETVQRKRAGKVVIASRDEDNLFYGLKLLNVVTPFLLFFFAAPFRLTMLSYSWLDVACNDVLQFMFNESNVKIVKAQNVCQVKLTFNFCFWKANVGTLLSWCLLEAE